MTELILDFDEFASVDTAEMEVRSANGRPTGWYWTFAGPAHPKAIAQSDKLARKSLRESKAKESARVNGKKWVAEDEDIATIRKNNIEYVVERLLGWSDISKKNAFGDVEKFPFSVENATALLSEPKNSALLKQAYEFLGDDESFTQR